MTTPVARETPWGSNVVVDAYNGTDWVDFSAYVIVPVGVTMETTIGRATELDTAEPGRFSFALLNRDSRFTPGNAASPNYPWWKQGCPVRIRELVGWRAFDLMYGYVEVIDNTAFTEVVGETDSDITVTVSGIDLVGRMQTGRKFISTLAAHILGSTPVSTLVGYWPMGDTTTTVRPVSYLNSVTLEAHSPFGSAVLIPRTYSVSNPEDVSDNMLVAGGGDPMPGDDLPCMHWETPGHISGVAFPGAIRDLYASFINWTVTPERLVTVLVWLRTKDSAGTGTDYLSGTIWELNGPGADLFSLSHNESHSNNPGAPSGYLGYEFGVAASNAAATWTTSGAGLGYSNGFATLVTAQLNTSDHTVTLWVGDKAELVFTPSATVAPAIGFFDTLTVGRTYSGDMAHLQVYVGEVGTFTHDHHLAQLEVGLNGLARQTTGQRVNSIADYAGVSTAARDVDDGVVLMSKVALAGKTADDAWNEAVNTERGRLTTDAGRLVFHDRRHTFDI